eukprot:TRINITY_DN830_c0_g4_i1.p1 TRINITY_DN830_c0_g4~~TRINITY_DN830_c0_g4_i1.p1  ORF type:complete len:393 (+),score=99.98 TRINITY_DN830_c0_g4_i1:48-1226(+)
MQALRSSIRRSYSTASGTYKIALIAGDGPGNRLVNACAHVLESLLPNQPQFIRIDAGFEFFQRQRKPLATDALQTLQSCHGAIFGALSSPRERTPGYESPIITIRKAMDLYSNTRHIASIPTPDSRKNVDLLIIRENTECLFSSQERIDGARETAVADRIITRQASQKIAKLAFQVTKNKHKQRLEEAERQFMEMRSRGEVVEDLRKKVAPPRLTIVHKANVFALTDGLFKEAVLDESVNHPEVKVDEELVDMMAFRLYREPENFDVLLCPNFYGDILQDAGTALVGSMGVVPTANFNDKFILAHGSNIVIQPGTSASTELNPYGIIRAAGLLISQLGEHTVGLAIEGGVKASISKQIFTPDMGGRNTLEEVTESVIGEARYLRHLSSIDRE